MMTLILGRELMFSPLQVPVSTAVATSTTLEIVLVVLLASTVVPIVYRYAVASTCVRDDAQHAALPITSSLFRSVWRQEEFGGLQRRSFSTTARPKQTILTATLTYIIGARPSSAL
eukprot:COSAG03_NODE_9533_length_712_cov_2.123980_1_plen_115_part_01